MAEGQVSFYKFIHISSPFIYSSASKKLCHAVHHLDKCVSYLKNSWKFQNSKWQDTRIVVCHVTPQMSLVETSWHLDWEEAVEKYPKNELVFSNNLISWCVQMYSHLSCSWVWGRICTTVVVFMTPSHSQQYLLLDLNWNWPKKMLLEFGFN